VVPATRLFSKEVHRSELTIDLGAVRHNVRRLLDRLEGAQLWAVVKADGYGHGAADVAGAALGAGASCLCVATVAEGLALRRDFPGARILVMCPAETEREVADARTASLELVVSGGEIPAGVRVHLKLDTGMGRWGLSELPRPPVEVVGLMSQLATADTDSAFADWQVERFREATKAFSHLTRHLANSAAALRYPAARFDAARCGIALYGLSPFRTDPAEDGLRPVLGWTSHLAQARLLPAGYSTGYGRRFVAEQPTWIGIVPVGYADGFRRDLTGTQVRVGDELRRVVGTVSMDAFAVELAEELPVGTPVGIVGSGVLAERHAEIADTITYELVCGINSDPTRARRVVVDA
jgi:alanine racemase